MPGRPAEGRIRTGFSLKPKTIEKIKKFRDEVRKNTPRQQYQFNLSDAAETLFSMGFDNGPAQTIWDVPSPDLMNEICELLHKTGHPEAIVDVIGQIRATHHALRDERPFEVKIRDALPEPHKSDDGSKPRRWTPPPPKVKTDD